MCLLFLLQSPSPSSTACSGCNSYNILQLYILFIYYMVALRAASITYESCRSASRRELYVPTEKGKRKTTG